MQEEKENKKMARIYKQKQWWCLIKVETYLAQIIVEDMHRMMRDFLCGISFLKTPSIIFNLSYKLLTFLVQVWIL
jgi:hypothetical protein